MFTLQSPIDPRSDGKIQLNQMFGENANDFYRQLGLKGHNGIDFDTSKYQDGQGPIYAAHDGYVISDKTIQKDTSGRFVRLRTDEIVIDGKTCYVETVYFHLKEARVSITDDISKSWFDWGRILNKGSRFIKAGQLIGISDNTGQYTTGAHLHFGMYIYWKDSNGMFSKDWKNGYDGAVDPLPYFKDDHIMWGWTNGYYYWNGEKISADQAGPLLKTLREIYSFK